MRTLSTTAAFSVLVITLAGCVNEQPIGLLEKPVTFLMIPCSEVPKIKAGDDLINHDAELRSQYGKCSAKLRGLQKYVKAVTKG